MSESVHAPAPVALAVPDGEIGAALGFAVGEARRHGCSVRLVGYDELLLHRVAGRVAGIAVTLAVVGGPPMRAVLDACADTRLVVVRKRDLLHLVRALTAPDEVFPTAWADPPVACVPSGWVSAAADDRPVVVGVEHPEHADALVARTRAACGAGPLLTVHASHDRAGRELVDRSARSRLLVLARNAADARGGTRLGRTARTVLYASRCPVLLLPPDGRGELADEDLDEDREGPRAATTSGHLPVDDASPVPSPGSEPRRRPRAPVRPG